jgi:hypothetical protein
MESGSRSTMGMAREHSQSSVIEKIGREGDEPLNRAGGAPPAKPPPPKRFQRHKIQNKDNNKGSSLNTSFEKSELEHGQ